MKGPDEQFEAAKVTAGFRVPGGDKEMEPGQLAVCESGFPAGRSLVGFP